MSPVFSSTRQAVGFVFIVSVILLLPWLVGRNGLPTREEIYASAGWRIGLYPYIEQQLFQKSGDVDIAFMGSSHIAAGIDPGYVQKQLSDKLGRPATVISLCWGSAGFDALYFIARDLLQRRKVHTLGFYDARGTDAPQVEAWRLVRFGDDGDALAGLPLRLKIAYYYGAILGIPRNLINLIRPSLPANPAPNLSRCIFKPPPDWLDPSLAGSVPQPNFSGEIPSHRAQPSDVSVFSAATAGNFEFSALPVPPLQFYFARKLAALAHDHGTQLVCLNPPLLNDSRNPAVGVSGLWPYALRGDSTLIGIPPDVLFGGMSDSAVRGLYSDSAHLNAVGKAYFTQMVTPTLIEVYNEARP